MYLYRIITFMDHPDIFAKPRQMLMGGSGVIIYTEKQRVFVIRKVFYDDDVTPLWSEPSYQERRYTSLQELRKDHPHHIIWDSPILDKDHYLKEYNYEEVIEL
jgi:hypothetical protein